MVDLVSFNVADTMDITMDITKGMDFAKVEDTQKAMQYTEKNEPMLIIGRQ